MSMEDIEVIALVHNNPRRLVDAEPLGIRETTSGYVLVNLQAEADQAKSMRRLQKFYYGCMAAAAAIITIIIISHLF